MRLRAYTAATDESAVAALWARALGQRWPISRDAFGRVLTARGAAGAGHHLVADGGAGGAGVIGFVATQLRSTPGAPEPLGSILVVAVDPAHRRRGVGRALMDASLDHLHSLGARRVQLGGGGHSYFWPGVPLDLPDAWPFFAALGWEETERSHDLVCPLGDFATPAAILAPIAEKGIALREATAADAPAVLAFEQEHFPAWLGFFERAATPGARERIVLAAAPDGAILGTALVGAPDPTGKPVVLWDELLGPDTGTIGAVGVAEAAREQGIGLALAARATELAQARGAARCLAGWTWLVDWYGRLGYRPWREYRMTWRSPPPPLAT